VASIGGFGLSGCVGNDGGTDDNTSSDDGTDGSTDGGTTGGTDDAPITIGGTYPETGPFAIMTPHFVPPMEIAVEEINANGGINGREVELITRDDEVDLELAIQETQRLIENEDLDVVVGNFNSAIGLAMSEFTMEEGLPYVNNANLSPLLTGEDCRRNTFRLTHHGEAPFGAIGRAVAELTDPDVTRVAGINPDYVFGRDAWRIFVNTFQEQRPDVEVVTEMWPGVAQTDFENEIQAVLDEEPDLVFSALWAGAMTAFVEQAKGFNFFKEVPEFATALPTFVGQILEDEMVEMIGGDYTHFNFPQTDANLEFAEKFREREGFAPTIAAGHCYGSIYAIKNAIERGGSAQMDDFIEGMRGLEFSTPQGDVLVREADHQALFDGIACGRLGEVDYTETMSFTEDSIILYNAADVTPDPDPACEF